MVNKELPMTLPDFLIIGAEKSGTTTLYHYLRDHPQIALSSTKEVGYFNYYSSNLGENRVYEARGLDWYSQFFSLRETDQLVGEACPMYLCDPFAPSRIASDLPKVKLIAVLRNPIYRAYSHYCMAYGKGDISASFDEVLANYEHPFLTRGLYAQQLTNYYHHFAKDQIKVILFERLIDHPERLLSEVCQFLKIGQLDMDYGNQLKYNESGAVRSVRLLRVVRSLVYALRKTYNLNIVVNLSKKMGLAAWLKKMNWRRCSYAQMTASQYRWLQAYYYDDIERLGQLLGRDLLAFWGIDG